MTILSSSTDIADIRKRFEAAARAVSNGANGDIRRFYEGASEKDLRAADEALRGLAQAGTDRGVNAWEPVDFWKFAGGLAGEHEADQMRDMLAERGLQIVGITDPAYQPPLPGLVATLRSHADDCEDDAKWATPELAPLLRRAAEVIEAGVSPVPSTDGKCTCGYLYGHADDCPAISSTNRSGEA